MRRVAGWRPDKATEVAAASSDELALLHMLLEFSAPTDMLLWALKRAADAEWLIPSQNLHKGFLTHNISARINGLVGW